MGDAGAKPPIHTDISRWRLSHCKSVPSNKSIITDYLVNNVQIYRTYLVWDDTPSVVILPAVMLLAYTGIF